MTKARAVELEGRARLAWAGWLVPLGVALTVRFANLGRLLRPDGIAFPGTDPWHHLRLAQNLVHHFPHRIHFDVYAGFPAGQWLRTGPLLDLVIAGIALLLGGGAPSERLVEWVALIVPPVAGALLVVPTYLLARALAGRRAAVFAALMAAVLPGEILRRSLAGNADHHVLETLLAMVVLLSLALSLRELDDDRPSRRAWALAGLAGAALGGYLLAWTSGTFLLGVLALWIALEVVRRLARGEGALGFLGLQALVLGTALAVVVGWRTDIPGMELNVWALLGGLVAAAILAAYALACARARVPRAARLLGLALLVAAGAGTAALVRPGLFSETSEGLARLAMRRQDAAGIWEAQPVYWTSAGFSVAQLWREHSTGWVAVLVGLPLLVVRAARTRRSELALLSVAAVAFLAAELVQRRFSPYLGMLVPVLGALVFEAAAARLAVARPTLARVAGAVALAALLLPAGVEAVRTARESAGPPAYWMDALRWMRANTPEPLPPGTFEALVPRPADNADYPYPRSAYGVLSWWDSGHWITYLARRIPITNPTQVRAREAAEVLLEEDPHVALERLERLGARYVIVDASMSVGPEGWLLPAIAAWGGRQESDLALTVMARDGKGGLVPAMVFTPAFYRAAMTRLFAFGGRAYEPHNSSWVVDLGERTGSHGQRFQELVSVRQFETHSAAEEYLRQHPAPNRLLVGTSAVTSPVPLEPIEAIRPVYESKEMTYVPVGGGFSVALPVLRIFEVEPPVSGE